MKALVKYASGDGHVGIREVEEPRCGDNEVKLEVAFCGVCGTDLHVLHDTFRNYPPVILGHEFAGTVVEIGANVRDAHIGERVAGLGATAVTCGQCVHCRSGYFIFCPQRRGMGHGVNGAFTRYVVLRPDQLYRVPANFSLEEAALSEPFAAVLQAVNEIARVRPGETALVSGPGPMGLLCLKLLLTEGVNVIVAGTTGDELRMAAALRIGASAVINAGEKAGEQNLGEAVREHTSGAGVDVAFECAGHPASVRNCLESLRPMGRYTQIAVCGREIPFPMDLIFSRQLTLCGSVCYTAATWARMMEIFAQGRIRMGDLVSAKLPISEWQSAFALCADRAAIKVLMYPEN